MAADGRRAQCLVVFEISFPDQTSLLTEGIRYDSVVSDARCIPLPQKLLAKLRGRKAEAKAAEARMISGCICKYRGFVGEEDGQAITVGTKIIFEWLHVRKLDNDPYVCQIKYRNLISLGRPVPNCPMRVQGRPGLLYTVAFFDAFDANISPGLQYCGVVYDGASLALERALRLGGVDVFDEAVYWMFGNGVLRCCSARALQRAGPAAGNTS